MPGRGWLRNGANLFHSHGGGFETGSSSSILSEATAISGAFYQGANIVKRSLEMNQPVIVASIQYRLAHFGFSASKELEQAGLTNLGFEDQRNALRWIQNNIAKVSPFPKLQCEAWSKRSSFNIGLQPVLSVNEHFL